MNQNFEILAPAGSFEILKQVIHAGADAVYLGGELFGARAYANNFTKEELLEALDYVHLRGKKLYLTVNTLLKNQELDRLYEYLLPFYQNGLDAVLVQDLGALKFIHEHFPDLPIHTSTQMTVTGTDGVNLLKEYGVTRVVMAREVSIEEMKNIHEETGMELESFVHGALCYSYSGQCLFSSMLGGRSGNRGRCAQPCRLPYTVLDEQKKVITKESYVLSLKDLCGITHLKELQEAGVYSLKIEGRMKSAEYAAGVVSMYRKYVDMLGENTGGKNSDTTCQVSDFDYEKLRQIGNRCGFTDTYMHAHNGKEMVTFEKPSFCSEIDSFPVKEQYVPIHGFAKFKAGEPSVLSIFCEEEKISAEVNGQTPEAAKSKPVTKEELIARISKTKDTAFLFEHLEIDMSEDLFIPNGAVNQLKRDGIAALEQEILKKYKRNQERELIENTSQPDVQKNEDEKFTYIISLEKRDLLLTALKQGWATDIYLDSTIYDRNSMFESLKSDIEACHFAKKRAFLILPSIFRKDTSDFYRKNISRLKELPLDGFVAKTYEEIFFVKEHFNETELICDHNIYTYNDLAVTVLKDWGIVKNTIPLELNRSEIRERNNQDSQMLVYGYYPLMTTACCVHKNTKGCDRTPGICYLRDRYNKEFAVRNCCNDCVNILYNSVPTLLFSSYKELCRENVKDFRLHFSNETEMETEQICREFGDLLAKEGEYVPRKKDAAYTKGHYKRGVE